MNELEQILYDHYMLPSGTRCSCGALLLAGVSINTRGQHAKHVAKVLSDNGYGYVRPVAAPVASRPSTSARGRKKTVEVEVEGIVEGNGEGAGNVKQ